MSCNIQQNDAVVFVAIAGMCSIFQLYYCSRYCILLLWLPMETSLPFCLRIDLSLYVSSEAIPWSYFLWSLFLIVDNILWISSSMSFIKTDFYFPSYFFLFYFDFCFKLKVCGKFVGCLYIYIFVIFNLLLYLTRWLDLNILLKKKIYIKMNILSILVMKTTWRVSCFLNLFWNFVFL